MNHMNSSYLYAATLVETTQAGTLYDKVGTEIGLATTVGQGYPNPFVKGVTIPFVLNEDNTRIQLKIYDMLGKSVRTIGVDSARAGFQTIAWDGRSDLGMPVKSGTYFYQLRGDKGVLSAPRRVAKI